MNVSLKNRMGTESHGGDGGLLEDREDGEDDGVTAVLREDTERRAASVPAAGGGRAVQSVEELLQLHPWRRERGKTVRTDLNASRSPQLSNVPLETLRGI